MAPNTKIILEAVAEVQKAKADILSLAESVTKLSVALGKTVDKKFEIITGDSVKKLSDIEAGLVSLGNASTASSEKVQKSSAKAAESIDQAKDRETKAIKKALEAVEKEILATERAVAAKERQQAKLDRATAQKERAAQRSIDADKRSLEATLAAADRSIAAEDRKVQRLLAAIAKKEAAQEREKNKNAVRLANKIAAEERAAAAERSTAERTAASVLAAERRKAEAFLQSEAASKRHMGQLLSSADAQDKFSLSAQTAARSIQAFFASIVLNKLRELLVEITETGAAFEQYSNLLSAATGSNAAAGESFSSLKSFADTFGISLETLVQRFPRFAIAAKDSGLALDEIRTVFDAFAIANRAVGNSTEQTPACFRRARADFQQGRRPGRGAQTAVGAILCLPPITPWRRRSASRRRNWSSS
jgi:hypothetical protein